MSCNDSNACNNSSACSHCHVSNLSVDNALCVGGCSTLNANSASGGALVVANGATQTSGTLVDIQGVDDQTALTVTGDIQLHDTAIVSDDALTVDAPNSASIGIGTSTAGTHNAATVNIGTSGGRLIAIGSASATSVDIDAQDVEIGSNAGASVILASSGTGTVVAQSPLFAPCTVTSLSTGNDTYAAAMLVGGLILRTPTGGAVIDTTATAAEIVAAIAHAAVGSSFQFVVRNVAVAGSGMTVTVAGGTGVTASAVVSEEHTRLFLAVVTSATAGAEAVTVYNLGQLEN